MKLRDEIVWWLPFGYSLTYKGSPKTRWQWIRATWFGYVAAWKLMFRVAYLLSDRKMAIDSLRSAALLNPRTEIEVREYLTR